MNARRWRGFIASFPRAHAPGPPLAEGRILASACFAVPPHPAHSAAPGAAADTAPGRQCHCSPSARHAVEFSLDVDTSATAREHRPWRTSPRGHCRGGPVARFCVLPRSRSRSWLDPFERAAPTGQQRCRCVEPLRFPPHLGDTRHCHRDDGCTMTITFATEIEPAERSVTALPDLCCPIPGRQTSDAAELRVGLNARNVDRQGVSPEVRGSRVTTAIGPIGGIRMSPAIMPRFAGK
jgi:hypothetical protein